MSKNSYNPNKASVNPNNTGTATGRVVSIRLYDTAAEGKSAVLAVACPDNYETRDDQGRYVRHSQTVRFRAFVPDRFPERQAYLESLQRDDIVRVAYSVRTNNYVNSEGRQVNDQTLKIEDIVLLQAVEPDATTPDTIPDMTGREGAPLPGDDDLPF